MLVLTRRTGEQIIIGDNIRVTVVNLGPGRVKIGIEAPPDVRIDREEVHQKIQKELIEASDVLATVGRVEAEEPSPTAVVASGDTSTRVHRMGAAEAGRPLALPDTHYSRKPR
jgi:carbon storage regulator